MMIFDSFPTRGHAEFFRAKIEKLYPMRNVAIYDDAEEAHKEDPFPFELTTPVVHVSRYYSNEQWDSEEEIAIQELVKGFSGVFCGT